MPENARTRIQSQSQPEPIKNQKKNQMKITRPDKEMVVEEVAERDGARERDWDVVHQEQEWDVVHIVNQEREWDVVHQYNDKLLNYTRQLATRMIIEEVCLSFKEVRYFGSWKSGSWKSGKGQGY